MITKNFPTQKFLSFLLIAIFALPFSALSQTIKNDGSVLPLSTKAALPDFTINLSSLAARGSIESTTGFEKESAELFHAFGSKKSVLLVDTNQTDRISVLRNAAILASSTENRKNDVWIVDLSMLVSTSDSIPTSIERLENIVRSATQHEKPISLFVDDVSVISGKTARYSKELTKLLQNASN